MTHEEMRVYQEDLASRMNLGWWYGVRCEPYHHPGFRLTKAIAFRLARDAAERSTLKRIIALYAAKRSRAFGASA